MAERLQSTTYVPEVLLSSGVRELLITLEIMVTTVEASELLILATSTSCFTLLTTFDTYREDRQTDGWTDRQEWKKEVLNLSGGSHKVHRESIAPPRWTAGCW